MAAALEHLRASHATLRSARAVPAWLAQRQDEALDAFLARGFPSLKDEDWRYTNLRTLREVPLTLPAAGRAAEPHPALRDCGFAIDITPGVPVKIAGTPPAGLHIQTLAAALDGDQRERIQAIFGDMAGRRGGAFGHLNEAFAADTLVVTVQPDAQVGTPLLINWLCAAQDDALSSPRLLLVAGRNSKVCVVEQRVVAGGVCNGVSELHLAAGARVDYVDLKLDAAQSQHIGSVYAHLHNDADLRATSIAPGGTLLRNDMVVELAARGAQVTLHGVFIAAEGEHVDNHTAIEHLAADTHSSEDYRGIIGKMGHGVFNGKVVVHEDAQRITSAQSNDNLLLDDSAEIDTKPELQIYADDVRCSHGATVGRLDETALFYLRSRGLDETAARRVLLDGFAAHALRLLPDSGLRAALTGLVSEELRRRLTEDLK